MTFDHITNFIKFTTKLVLKKTQTSLEQKKELDEKEISDKIYHYPINEVLKEINQNFTSYILRPDIEEKLNENYNLYVSELKKIKKYCSKQAEMVLQLRINQITQQLLTPTYLPPHLSDTVISDESETLSTSADRNPEDALALYRKNGNVEVLLPRRLLKAEFTDKKKLTRFIEESNKNYRHFFNKISAEEWAELKNDFTDYFQKLADSQSVTKYREWLEEFVAKINSYFNFHKSRKDKIENFKDSINFSVFELVKEYKSKDGKLNQLYYGKIIKEWEDQRLKFLLEQEVFLDRRELAEGFIQTLGHMLICSFEAFDAISKYSEEKRQVLNKYNLKKLDIESTLKRLLDYVDVIKLNVISEKYRLAIKLQELMLHLYEEALDIFSKLGIDIFKSPLNLAYNEVFTQLKDVIDPQKLALLRSIEKDDTDDSQSPMREKYQHTHIFKDNAFEVWQSMFEAFNVTKKSRTDVKFMFDIMKKEGLIYNTVREVDFLNWINSTYQMAISKISYANLKDQKRVAIYNNAKELYKG